MKTANEYLEELQSKGGELGDTIEDNKEAFLVVLKSYAKQVADQALQDASFRLYINPNIKNISHLEGMKIIALTPIQLP